MNASYDPIANVYNRYWGPFAKERFIPFLKRYLLPRLPSKARVLDLCCGTGQIDAWLAGEGYQVTGVDISKAMIYLARQNAPRVDFLVQDVRRLGLRSEYHAVISLFASLNHMRGRDELRRVFENAYVCLRGTGWFLFDLNTEQGFLDRWQGEAVVVEDDWVLISRATYDSEKKMARTEITCFELSRDGWERKDTELHHWSYETEEVTRWLRAVGFEKVEIYRTSYGQRTGRVFFLAQKPEVGRA